MSNKYPGANGFKKGNIPWNKNKKLTPEQLKNHHWLIGAREKSPAWKGGKRKNEKGYIVINLDYETGRKNVLEHRKMIEKHLGRLLRKSEVVHHINGKKDDNRLENLELMERIKHNNRWRTKCPCCGHVFNC